MTSDLRYDLGVSYQSPEKPRVADGLVARFVEKGLPPVSGFCDRGRNQHRVPPLPFVSWPENWRCRGSAKWGSTGNRGFSLYFDEPDSLKLRLWCHPGQPTEALLYRLVDDLPFTYAACDAHHEWESDYEPGKRPLFTDRYLGPGFGGGFDTLGWFAAFRGEQGHRHLVSRRILAYGPWRIVRRPGDITIVQFYDPDASKDLTLEQAKPGHEPLWKAFFTETARLPRPYEFDYGLFDARQRTLTRVVPAGKEMDEIAIHVFCRARNFPRLDLGPIARVDFVFLDPEQARRELHRLWLYGYGCRTFLHGREVDLTETYTPPPPTLPPWVRDLDRKHGVDSFAVRQELLDFPIPAADPSEPVVPERRPPKRGTPPAVHAELVRDYPALRNPLTKACHFAYLGEREAAYEALDELAEHLSADDHKALEITLGDLLKEARKRGG